MGIRFFRCLPAAVAFLLWAARPSFSQIAEVGLADGKLEGVVRDGVASFKGIPFAAPPVGDLRWKAPQPPRPWTGVRKADAFGPAPLQDAGLMAAFLGGSARIGEDCLYLNVWTPARDAGEKLPVMVWIYGGAFIGGMTSFPVYDGTRLAQKGVVLVSIAYRVGPFGFLAHPELTRESGKGSGCYGIQDQVAGLRWVKDNIARFGGDPSRVTIFGESAGGISVSMLTVVPAARGLFQRAISESGGSMAPVKRDAEAGQNVPSLALAEETGKKFLQKLGAKDLAAARALPAEQIQKGGGALGTFWPAADGETIPGDQYELFEAGRFNDTPILVGTNSDEGAMFVRGGVTAAAFERRIRAECGPAAEAILAAYPHATDDEAFRSTKDIFRESAFAWHTWAWAELEARKGKNRAFVYFFDHRTTRSPDGATHAAEIPYVFRNLGGRGGAPAAEDTALSELMSSYWVNFARSGDPNGPGLPEWPAYDGEGKKTMIFDGSPGARPLPNQEKLKAFDAYYAWRRAQAKARAEAGGGSAASATAPAAEGFLRTRGTDIVDEKGAKVLLRGVGLGNWLLPEGYMWKFGDRGDRPRRIEAIVADLIGPEAAEAFWKEFRRRYIVEADIRRIAELGFNSVRPALNARLFLTEGEEAVDVAEGYELMDRLIGWCKAHGLYVILDMHGAPGGQTGSNIDDSPDDKPGLFDDPRNQDRLVALWVKIARRYQDEPTVAAYDLLNEPLPARTGAAAQYKDRLEPLYKRIAKAIREVDPKHMITVEGADWANDWSVFTEPFDPNLFYQFHYYCWNRPTALNGIERFLAWRDRLKAPVWVGETGEKDNAIYWGTTQYFEENNIGWSFWPWKKMDARNAPCSIRPPEGWGAIAAVSRGGPKPSREAARKAFDELLENIKLERCEFFPDVVNAILRRIPGRVEAENYGHRGPGVSFSVKDGAAKSKFYRTGEPVPIEPVETPGGGRGRSGQAIVLGAGEWVAFAVESGEAREFEASLMAKAEAAPAVVRLSVGEASQDVTVAADGWTEVRATAAGFARGSNRVKLAVQEGKVRVDWLSFR